MMGHITLYVGGPSAAFKYFIFPGGEPHVQIDYTSNIRGNLILIDARIGSMNDFGVLLALTDAIKSLHPGTFHLFLPYFPGARQDRNYDLPGTPLTVKVFADIINAQRYDMVGVVDPHSPVVMSVLKRAKVVDHELYLKLFISEKSIDTIINPDAGAAKRNYNLINSFRNMASVTANKHRDPKTGNIKMSLDKDQLQGKYRNYLVIDDICDGGATFACLAESLFKIVKRKNAKLYLWVTHGIFSGAYENNLKLFDGIGCTDSFPRSEPYPEKVSVYKLNPKRIYE